jgi:hypothetical protein
MTHCLFADELKDFVIQLFLHDNTDGMEEWKRLTPIEFGILRWHLNKFYSCPLGWNIERTARFARCIRPEWPRSISRIADAG